ncbi:MAG: cellulase family glycosylhydrolase [Firmicutes bacterium]|nr:cellulase family glycosylhydrolase [Bacillota bacterium]
MKQNIKFALGALAIFVAGGIFATALITVVKPKEAEATLKEDAYRYYEMKHGEITTQQTNGETAAAAPTEKTEKQDDTVSVIVTPTNTWAEGSNAVQQFSVAVTNNGAAAINDWTCVIEFDGEVMDNINGWGGASYTALGKTVTISPTEPWAKEIQPGDSKKDFGFQLRSATGVTYKTAKFTSDLGEIKIENKEAEASPAPVEVESYDGTSPVALHGQLAVKGTQIVDKNGEPVILQGVSTHGIAWFPAYVDKEGFKTLRDTMGVNTIRLALYSSTNEGYSKAMHQKVIDGVNYAKELGMYVIIDWHILANGNPNTDKEAAKAFFTEMTGKFKDYDNVIYEICNEPNGGVTWENDIKPYAVDMINHIRAVDDNAIIIVGTPTWSQDVDIVSQSPITGQSNIMYALHFYASTHRQELRNKLNTALSAGLPVFVSEFGISEASGAGMIDENEGTTWINYLRSKGVGYVCWNLSNKNEACALIKDSCTKTSGWTDDDLTQQGKWLKKVYTSK